MKEINNYLFAYGTLLLAGNEFANYLNQNCSFYGPGKVEGILYDIGHYPGIILLPGREQFVNGNIYLLNDPETTLKVLDHYEGITDDDQPDEYMRKITAIETNDRTLDCWIYEYNFPVDGLKQITSGDYIKYLDITR